MSHVLFRGIIGHERIQEVLSRALESDGLAHAYLFVGPEGVGKTALAESLLSHLFDGRSLDAVADFTRLTRLVDEKTGKEKQTISVKQVRELTQRFSRSAIGGGYKAAFIEEADALNQSAANALLKTLEEPRGNALMILCAAHEESVPATIASRCQILRFHLVERSGIASALEKKGLSPKDADAIAALSLGRPGHALRLFQDSAFRAERETAIGSLVQLFSEPIPSRLGAVASMLPKDEVNKRQAATQRLDLWELLLRDILLQQVGQPELCACVGASEQIARLAQSHSSSTIRSAMDRLRESRRAVAANGNPQLALEHVLLAL